MKTIKIIVATLSFLPYLAMANNLSAKAAEPSGADLSCTKAPNATTLYNGSEIATTQVAVTKKSPVTQYRKPVAQKNNSAVATGKTVVKKGQPNGQSTKAPMQNTKASAQPRYKEVAYTLKGKAHGFSEGEYIRLCEIGPKGMVTVDSMKLNGEEFLFKGTTLNIPRMEFLVIGEGVKKTLVEVFLEEGTINAEITADKRIDKVSGTKHNDIYTPYRDSINLVYTDLYNCIHESLKLTNSKEDREAYKLGADSMRNRIVELTYSFAKRNLNNWVGIYLFAEYHKRFSLQQNNALLARIPPKYSSLPIIAEIRRFTKGQK